MPGMIDRLGNTVLILGAGASRPFGFPIGLELHRMLEAAHIQRDEFLATLPIVHVHGHMGAMDVVHGKGRAYGDISPELLKEAASRMVTIHEEQTAKYWERAHQLLAGAKHVMFLGFGYGKENLERLSMG